MPRTRLGNTTEELKRLISANDKLRVCFDTNHLLKDDNVSFIKEIGDKIVTLHVCDFDLIDEKHWLPGEGKNDWQGILYELQKINYSGAWLYEVLLKTPATIKRNRDLVYTDFVENAQSLFNGKMPKRI